MNISLNKFLHELSYDKKAPLLFNSSFFLIFFALFLLVYVALQKKTTLRLYFLTLFSLYFFYKASGWYVALILIAAVVDYNLSHLIYKQQNKRNKNLLLIVSVTLNLGLLFYFKYTNFFIDIANSVSSAHFKPLSLVLPVGISFYTFENLSYTVDVYRGTFKPVKRFIDYLFFLSFFPKLMMGPIVRAADFIPQINKEPFVDSQRLGEGLYLLCSGIIKKMVISDFLTANYVSYIFDDPSKHTGIECLFAVYAYAMVIYCDFSGYSDMARGIAKWIGFEINLNFMSPYQSSSITEFWRRWHISLSTWLRDYLYIPLGGNRKGKFNTYRNLFITMLLGGLWHGASWNFIFWGGLHGAALAIDKWRMTMAKKIKPAFTLPKGFGKALGIIITFHFVCFCWIFFKCETFEKSWVMIGEIFGNFRPDVAGALL
ncbi:MAG TPA: MBOAT family O-acyltransferase, partial [Chitinophagaceae bacterium]|nr:MBOAT family O-acyltransferase [Chitinophagaceae bacterium]